MARSIDSRYWERRSELSRESGSSNSKTPDQRNSSEGKKSDKKNKASTSTSNNSGQRSNNNNNNNNKNPKSNNSGQHTPKSDLSSKLGKDGKLTPAERQRRFANNLCLFCGEAGHTAKECSKSGSSASKGKGRAAKSEPKSDASTEDSKKA